MGFFDLKSLQTARFRTNAGLFQVFLFELQRFLLKFGEKAGAADKKKSRKKSHRAGILRKYRHINANKHKKPKIESFSRKPKKSNRKEGIHFPLRVLDNQKARRELCQTVTAASGQGLDASRKICTQKSPRGIGGIAL
jgi:hypothetical protein